MKLSCDLRSAQLEVSLAMEKRRPGVPVRREGVGVGACPSRRGMSEEANATHSFRLFVLPPLSPKNSPGLRPITSEAILGS